MSPASACAQAQLVDRHFAGRLRPTAEHRLREHLPDCGACRARYERHLLLAEVDPRALSARERLGRGLGLARAAPGPVRTWAPRLGLAAAAACALLLVLPSAEPPPDAGFSARGGERAAPAAPPALQVYRVGAGGKAEPAAGQVAAADELAFAYRNAAGWPYVMVFGVDGTGQVFWYHPSWTDAAANPRALSAAPGEGPHELSEAVRQPLTPGALSLYTLFSREPLTVREVEARLARGGAGALGGPGHALHRVAVEVRP